uniref:ORF436 protein n=1 Tax=Mankyua chejuensis TaxID=996148 RepID=H8Y614_9MONI|nr:hypothetical protein [Mankyua chejuensis]AJJ48612.1 ORF436 [Mankyua chejuensis]
MSIRHTIDSENSNEYFPQSLVSPFENLRLYLWRSLLENKAVASNEEFQGTLIYVNSQMTELLERMDVSPLSDLIISMYASQLVIQMTLIHLLKEEDASGSTGVFFTSQRTLKRELIPRGQVDPLARLLESLLTKFKALSEQTIDFFSQNNARLEMLKALLSHMSNSLKNIEDLLNKILTSLDNNLIKMEKRSHYNFLQEDQRGLKEGLFRLEKKLDNLANIIGYFETKQSENSSLTICSALDRISSQLLETPRETAYRVGEEMVGESYYRWDSMVRYFPTLILLFLNKETNPKKRAQVKARLTKYPNDMDFDEKDLTELQKCCKVHLGDLNFVAGNLRCNYVSSHHSKWKTTLFTHTPEDCTKILQAISAIIGEDFDPNQVSYTQGRGPSPVPQRLSNALTRSDIMEDDSPLKMDIYKAVLLLNGAESPITLYRA